MNWTMPELERARVLAFDVKLPSGSIAKLLAHEFGSMRTPATVRQTLRRRYGWEGETRGTQTGLKRGK
jgi:hypothetical protein